MGAPKVVVLDTNVLVSALGWKGPERLVYRACRRGILRMATSHALLVDVVGDETDNRVLECALAAKARWVVSGDRHLLALHHYRGVRIENAREFLALFPA